MAETVTLEILSGGYAQRSSGTWSDSWVEGNNELYAGRNNSVFYHSCMRFNTNGLPVGKGVTMSLELTVSQKSNPYGTSLILTKTELPPADIYSLTTEDAVKALDGFVALCHCTSHTESGNISKDDKASYTLTADLEKDTTYYIYIKRRVGWENDTTGLNGWTAWYNPTYSDDFNDYVTLTLVYEPEEITDPNGPRVFHNSTWKKGTAYVWHNGAWVKGTSNVFK